MIEYHKSNGDIAEPIFSHSGYCRLEQHPLEFVKYVTQEERKQTPSMERGDLLHAWLQHKDQFIIADVDKPSDKLNNLAEAIYSVYCKQNYTDHFREYCKQNYSIGMDELQAYKDIFIALNKRVANDDEIKLLVYAMRFAREEAEFGGKPGSKGAYTEKTIIERIKDITPYLNHLQKAEGKVSMTKVDRDIVTNCHESLRRHPLANQLLFQLEGLVEHEMFWEENIDGILIKRKAKSDKIIIDRVNKILTVLDPKTTAKKVSEFAQYPFGPLHTYKYDGQLVSYAHGWFKTNPDENPNEWKTQLFSIPVQTIDPFPTTVYLVTPTPAIEARLLSLDRRAAFHVKTKNWNLTMEEQENGGYITI